MACRDLPTTVQIFVKDISKSDSRSIEVSPSWTVQELKEHLLSLYTYPISKQRLILNGEVMENHRTLLSHKLFRETTIHLVLETISNPVCPEGDRPQYEQLPLAKIDRISLPPYDKDYLSSLKIYVWCQNNIHKPLGDEAYGCRQLIDHLHEIQPGSVRVCCKVCKEEGIMTDTLDIRSWTDILEPGSKFKGWCFKCGNPQTGDPIEVDLDFIFKCQGVLNEPINGRELCKAESTSLSVRPLPGVVKNDPNNPILSLDTGLPDEYQLMFLSCGHRFSLPGVRNLNLEFDRDKFLRNETAPTSLGNYVIRCPSPGDCRGVMFRPTCKVLGKDLYDCVVDWDAKETTLAKGGAVCGNCERAFDIDTEDRNIIQTCPYCGMDFCLVHKRKFQDCNHQNLDDSVVKNLILKTILAGTNRKCPQCKQEGQVNLVKTKIDCRGCSTLWCYFCGKHLDSNHGCPQDLKEYPPCNTDKGRLRALLLLLQIRTVRMLLELKTRCDKRFDGMFERVFNSLSDVDRTIQVSLSERHTESLLIHSTAELTLPSNVPYFPE